MRGEVRVQGYFSNWPSVIRDFWEAFGWHQVRVRLGPPSAAAIDRMDEALVWLGWLEPDDARVVWMRASGKRWKNICWKVGLQRSAAHQHWLYALALIAWRLNGGRAPRVASHAREALRTRGARP
jgi:hypothetical protein